MNSRRRSPSTRPPRFSVQAGQTFTVGFIDNTYRIVERGRRTRVVMIATTLLDSMRYSKQQIAMLYGLRWEIETNFRRFKTPARSENIVNV